MTCGSAAPPPRFGLIGTGIWAQAIHAPAAAVSERVRFCGVFGRDLAAAQALARQHGVHAYARLEDLFDAVDLVGIAVSPQAQPPLALAALSAGKHVVLEKPMARTVAEAVAIVAAADERQRKVLVFFTHLMMPRLQAWLADRVRTGDWIAGRVDSFSSVLNDPANPYHRTIWRKEGGGLWDIGPHAAALLISVLGPVRDVFAVSGLDDFKSITLRHAAGAVSSINIAMDVPAALPGETAFYGADGKMILPPSPNWNAEALDGYMHALSCIADAIAGQVPQRCPDARFGLAVTEILVAAERSIKTGRRISLP